MKFTKKDIAKIIVILLAALVSAFNVRAFINAGELVPGGFSGLTLLLQRIAKAFLGIDIPYSVFYIPFNLLPAYLAYKYIGKKFTLYTVIFIVVNSLLVDIIPAGVAVTEDMLLIAIFGGIISAACGAALMMANASGGGTDIIAAYLFKHKNIMHAWDYILAFNVVMLAVSGLVFGWEKAMYSIIFQYTNHQAFLMLYKNNQQKTLFIVTDKSKEVCAMISELTHHSATIMVGQGAYETQFRTIVYSVVSANQISPVLKGIKEIDAKAFINVMGTDRMQGKFFIEKSE